MSPWQGETSLVRYGEACLGAKREGSRGAARAQCCARLYARDRVVLEPGCGGSSYSRGILWCSFTSVGYCYSAGINSRGLLLKQDSQARIVILIGQGPLCIG
ncbi:hypothetical protein JCGZ_01399 [Jatropha curcas]|uniref:Uncharacterized protein n=1 Tax=Jatropha curcas TaxID=180498 RepID=A0A067LKN3_JATCU|nr:hypothetical protein JCGZ_01399 [Jatropha curcas]